MELLVKRNASAFLTTLGATPPQATGRRAFVFLVMTLTLSL
jgi:hypothetical protein